MGRELACSTCSPALGTAALALSCFICLDPLPFKTSVWREEGRAEKAGGSQTLLLSGFLSFLFSFKCDLIDSHPLVN